MASLDSSIRSAARATYSAYKRQPIRWRLAGGSAALTLVILLGFAVIVGTLTTRAIYKDFNRQVSSAADRLQAQQYYEYYRNDDKGHPQYRFPIDRDAFAASTNAAIRVVTGTGRYFASSKGALGLTLRRMWLGGLVPPRHLCLGRARLPDPGAAAPPKPAATA